MREAGARIKLINDGDVAGAINTAFDHTGVDILFGSGGAPEGVLSAVALKALGGEIIGRLLPQSAEEQARCERMGLDVSKVLRMEDLVRGMTPFCRNGRHGRRAAERRSVQRLRRHD